MTDRAPLRRIGLGIAALAIWAVAPSASADDPPAAKPVAAKASDVESVDAIIAAVYDVISGPAGQPRDFDRMRSLFVPGARLIPVAPKPGGGAQARVLTVDQYIERAKPFFEAEGFFEREVARKVEAFGTMAHAFSTYESYHGKADPRPFARGINSIQLLKDGDRWWIVTVYWDAESDGVSIPAAYLPKP